MRGRHGFSLLLGAGEDYRLPVMGVPFQVDVHLGCGDKAVTDGAFAGAGWSYGAVHCGSVAGRGCEKGEVRKVG